MGNGLEEMAAAFDLRMRDLAARTRVLIVDVYPGVVEVPWARQNVAGYGVGPKKRTVELASLCTGTFVDQLLGRDRAWMSSKDRNPALRRQLGVVSQI